MVQRPLRHAQTLALFACTASQWAAAFRTGRSGMLLQEKDTSTVSFVQHSMTHTLGDSSDAAKPDLEDRGLQDHTLILKSDVPAKQVLTKRKHLAGPSVIIPLYIILFVPLCIGWIFIVCKGMTEAASPVIIPVTLCAAIVCTDLANQSVSAMMGAPMALTVIQLLAVVVISGIWFGGLQVAAPSASRSWCWPLVRWFAASTSYAVYQLVNHLVYSWCSLTERTVFLNLCPVALLFIETTLMPAKAQIRVSVQCKIALACMVVGAILFSARYADFTARGMGAAIILVFARATTRLLERYLLVDCTFLPIALLSCVDGVFGTIPPLVILRAEHAKDFWAPWGHWFQTPTICLLLVLSSLSFVLAHLSGLAILRISSATTYVVMHNLASAVVVLLGIIIFKDSARQPVEVIGLVLSFVGGIWYSLASKQSAPTDSKLGATSKLVDRP